MDSVDELVSKLTELGFFKFAPPENVAKIIEVIRGDIGESCREEFLTWALYGEMENDSLLPLDRRIYNADAEDLAERGICDFLEGVKPVFEIEGVKIESPLDDPQRTGEHDFNYPVWVNGRKYLIYDTLRGDNNNNFWCLAHKKTLEIINDLLVAAGSQERAYGIRSDNDADIVLLTDELFEFIHSLPLPEGAKPFRSETMNCE